jgi:hypothetical protein
MNQKLSMERAQNLIAFLIQNCNVPVRHIVAPGAMGEAAPVASNETKSGRAENRRVEVKVLLNKGLAGHGSKEWAQNPRPLLFSCLNEVTDASYSANSW